MNLKYLGDALDHWKGSLFEYLAGVNVLKDFAVDPMASDLRDWTEADYALFARLLRVEGSQLLRHKATLQDRSGYFNEITHLGDLYVDPDTGIATGSVSAQHVSPFEVASLLGRANNRLLAIYQHVRARKVSARVDDCIVGLKKHVGGFGWCSYESGTVAMLFLSVRFERAEAVAGALKELLGAHSGRRIRSGTCG